MMSREAQSAEFARTELSRRCVELGLRPERCSMSNSSLIMRNWRPISRSSVSTAGAELERLRRELRPFGGWWDGRSVDRCALTLMADVDTPTPDSWSERRENELKRAKVCGVY